MTDDEIKQHLVKFQAALVHGPAEMMLMFSFMRPDVSQHWRHWTSQGCQNFSP